MFVINRKRNSFGKAILYGGLILAVISVTGAYIFHFKYSYVPSVLHIGAALAATMTFLSIYFCHPAGSRIEVQARNLQWKNTGYGTLSVVVFLFGIFLSLNGVILGLLGLLGDFKLSLLGLLVLIIGLLAFKSAKKNFRKMKDISNA